MTPCPVDELFRALDQGRPVQARAVVDCLMKEAIQSGRAETEVDASWPRFVALLRRRGYFVSTPTELEGALEEIRALGAGFDLFDLAASLAAYDETCFGCLALRGAPAFPDLRRFAPPCSCDRHRGA